MFIIVIFAALEIINKYIKNGSEKMTDFVIKL